MPNWIQLGPVTAGPEPTLEQLKALQAQGFKTVIDLRRTGEKAKHIAPVEEETIVLSLGMQYVHIPVELELLDQNKVDEYRLHIADLWAPAFVHCSNGKRAALLSAIDLALKRYLSGQQTLNKLQRAGYPLKNYSVLSEWVVDYVDQHRRRTQKLIRSTPMRNTNVIRFDAVAS